MRICLLLLIVLCDNAALLDIRGMRLKRSSAEKSVGEKSEQEYEAARDEPDVVDDLNLTYLQQADMSLYQEDIWLTDEQNEKIQNDIEVDEGIRVKRQAYRNWRYPRTIWTDGVVYYNFYNASNDAKRVFGKAIEAWQNATCITFKESKTAKDKINVINAYGCWSRVGKAGGDQTLSLGNGCQTIGTAIHEIGHALGMFHTHSRHDRDDFIILIEENFRKGWKNQLDKEPKDRNYNYEIPYDYGSVMHYGSRIASRNGLPMIIPRNDSNYLFTMGSDTISFYDKLMMNYHYGCLKNCKDLCPTKCRNGGFPHPRNCSQCICPTGYGGDLCDKRPSGCGEILNATTIHKTLRVSMGSRNLYQAKDEADKCIYWIQAPIGSTIEVVLDSYMGDVTTDGCVYSGVEIKVMEDKRLTGYKFCSKNSSGRVMVSKDNLVIVTVYNRLFSNRIILKYRISKNYENIER